MGYTTMFLVAGVIMIAVLLALVAGRARPRGHIAGDPDKPPLRTEPSADAPTPGSAKVNAGTAEAARRHTPPA